VGRRGRLAPGASSSAVRSMGREEPPLAERRLRSKLVRMARLPVSPFSSSALISRELLEACPLMSLRGKGDKGSEKSP